VTRNIEPQAFLPETVRSAERELKRFARGEPAKAEVLMCA
jgi:hypothetical protein